MEFIGHRRNQHGIENNSNQSDQAGNTPEEVEYKEEHPVCEKCGSEMKEIGKKTHDELVYTLAFDI